MIIQDNFEELETWHPQAFPATQNYPGSPTYSVSTFTELCKLSVIMNDILNKVYAEKTTKRAPERLAEDLTSLHADLEKWETALPHHLRFENIGKAGIVPPPHVLSLQAMHKVLLILLHRPFVSEGHLHSTSSRIPTNSFFICAMAATKIVQLMRVYDQTFSIQQADATRESHGESAQSAHERHDGQLLERWHEENSGVGQYNQIADDLIWMQ